MIVMALPSASHSSAGRAFARAGRGAFVLVTPHVGTGFTVLHAESGGPEGPPDAGRGRDLRRGLHR
jgi:hypothetical protein